jgi:ABC-type transport system involved in multi-copper enzyme maturation permease subunit
MNINARCFIEEFKRNIISMGRTYVWLIGLILYSLLSITSFYPTSSVGLYSSTLPIETYYYTFFWENLIMSGGLSLMYILSSFLVSEDIENGNMKMLKSAKIPLYPVLLAKVLYIVVYSILITLISSFIFSLYFFSNIATFNSSYVPVIIYISLAFSLIFFIASMQGFFISTLFNKRIISAIVSFGTGLIIAVISSQIYTPLLLAHNGNLYAFTPISGPYYDKILILLNPYYFKGFIALLFGITHVNVPFPSTNQQPSSGVNFIVMTLYPNIYGYLEFVFVEMIVISVLIYISIKIKNR